MLEMSDAALAVVQQGYTMQVRAESWLGGILLADDIPIATGRETRDRSIAVPERVTLTVPRRDRGVDWSPTRPDHPLAAYGQQLKIEIGVQVGGHFEWINRGFFLITESSTDGDTVTVDAQGLKTLLDEARFVAPFQPASGDTLVSVTRALVEPALTVVFDSALTDRAVPLGMQWDEDRLGALHELLNAWPAEARVTEDGYLLVEPVVDPTTAVAELTDGANGTVVRWHGTTTRDSAYNAFVAQGEDSSGVQIQGVVYDMSTESPYRYGGSYNPLPVPYKTYSPLMSTIAQCRAAATTTMLRLRRTASRRLRVDLVPHPGLMPGDLVSVTGEGLVNVGCVIEDMETPYTPDIQTIYVRVPHG